MARRPDDPQVTDLRRYRRAREAQARQARAEAARVRAGRPGGREPLLGPRPRAGLVLAAVILLLAALTILPRLLGRG